MFRWAGFLDNIQCLDKLADEIATLRKICDAGLVTATTLDFKEFKDRADLDYFDAVIAADCVWIGSKKETYSTSHRAPLATGISKLASEDSQNFADNGKQKLGFVFVGVGDGTENGFFARADLTVTDVVKQIIAMNSYSVAPQ